jgi:signal transduction histidine kinase
MTEELAPTMPLVPAESNVATRVGAFTRDADLSWVVDLLGERRSEILERWVDAAADQPFHRSRSEHAVADHIPRLYDALRDLLRRFEDPSRDPGAPLEDPAVLAAAQSHARVRFEQGFTAPDVATEFRLLRQEIGRALRRYVSDRSPTTDVVGAELLLHDALDGAVFLALSALNEHEVARERAESALRDERIAVASERDAFFATLGHDLKSPLISASAIAQLLQHQTARGRVDPEQLAERLASISAALRRGALRVDELMDLARREGADPQALHLEAVDLVALVAGVLDGYRLTNDRHTFVLSGSAALVTACDRDRIERSVDNLVSNAVKFSPHGGTIAVHIAAERRDGVEEAVVTVRDEGLGIPEGERDAIFARFQRGSNVADVPGSGVGLWSVRRIVTEHGGSLEVESRIGVGSTFTIRLPIVGLAPLAG